jgi:predicted RNA methylase/uncharacterized protein (DUF3820 family)
VGNKKNKAAKSTKLYCLRKDGKFLAWDEEHMVKKPSEAARLSSTMCERKYPGYEMIPFPEAYDQWFMEKTYKGANMNIEQDVLVILTNSKIEGKVLYLPPERLDRKLYLKVNTVLTLIGGKWDRKKGGHVFEDDPADAIDEILLTGNVTDRKKEYQFFPTPLKIAKEICEMADITSQCDCLEPSAGKGNIADVIWGHSPKSLTVIELDESNASYLEGKYSQCLIGKDFLTLNTQKRFDRIVMNPPFSKKQDMKHILKAWEFLKPKGILVSILSPSPFYCNDKLSQDFREFLDENKAAVNDFDENEFKESGTSIRTKCIKVIKNA